MVQLTSPHRQIGKWHPVPQMASGPSGSSVLWGGFARKGVTTLDINAHQARDRAEAIFKKKQERLLDGQKATAEYEATRLATREKTARLRALRLARDIALKTPVSPAQKQSA